MLQFITNHKDIIFSLSGIVLVILFNVFKNKLRKSILKFMASAETKKALGIIGLEYNDVIKTIDKIEKSDWDDRMILVVAELIHAIPFTRFIPKAFITRILRREVQKVFDETRSFALSVSDSNIKRLTDENVITLVEDNVIELFEDENGEIEIPDVKELKEEIIEKVEDNFTSMFVR